MIRLWRDLESRPRPLAARGSWRSGSKGIALSAFLLAGVLAAIAGAAVVQQGNLRITLISQVMPYKLPRTGTAPIAILVSGHVAPVSGEVPDQLEGLRIRINRLPL